MNRRDDNARDGGRRPRLGAHVRARRHLVDGVSSVVLSTGEHEMSLGDREWTVVSCMDGSRDARGIAAAARRAGAAVREAHVEAFVARLDELSLLAPDADHETDDVAVDNALPPDRPVRSLPGYRFTCDGRGGCCGIFQTILFTPLETARARATLPQVCDGGYTPQNVFLPERGLDPTLLAVTYRDGACVYRDEARRCGLHAKGGPAAKPFGCGAFPARYVDTGAEIRVAPRPECSCVFDSVGRLEGAPLSDMRRGSELPVETFVPALSTARVGPDVASADALWAFFDRIELPEEGVDLAAWALSMADDIETSGLRAISPASASTDLPDLERLRERAEARVRQSAWRAETDLARRGFSWIAQAIARLSADGWIAPTRPELERHTLRSLLFIGALADAESIEEGLRAHALRMLIARAFPDDALADPAARHPLALVEALARGHGLP